MFEKWSTLIPNDFAAESRVWIYQASRVFRLNEALQIESLLEDFVANWKSHGIPVKGYGNLFFGQFLVLMADESATGVSGCSTDSSVHLVKEIERSFTVSMFDRQMLAFVYNEKIEMLPLSQFAFALQHNHITPETLYFNNTICTKEQLLEEWLVPIKDCWLAKRIPTTNLV